MGKLGGFGMVVYGLVFRSFLKSRNRGYPIESRWFAKRSVKSLGFLAHRLRPGLQSYGWEGTETLLLWRAWNGTVLSWDPAMATKLGSISMSCGDSVWNCSSFLNVSEISAIFIFSSGSWTLWGSFRFHRFVSSLLHMLRQRMRRLGTHLFWYDLIHLWGIDIGLIYEMPCQYHHVV